MPLIFYKIETHIFVLMAKFTVLILLNMVVRHIKCLTSGRRSLFLRVREVCTKS